MISHYYYNITYYTMLHDIVEFYMLMNLLLNIKTIPYNTL